MSLLLMVFHTEEHVGTFTDILRVNDDDDANKLIEFAKTHNMDAPIHEKEYNELTCGMDLSQLIPEGNTTNMVHIPNTLVQLSKLDCSTNCCDQCYPRPNYPYVVSLGASYGLYEGKVDRIIDLMEENKLSDDDADAIIDNVLKPYKLGNKTFGMSLFVYLDGCNVPRETRLGEFNSFELQNMQIV